jgi:predicted amidohydrolase
MKTVAAVQMISSPSVTDNIATARRLIGQAADAGAQLVLLPEYWAIMGLSDTDKVAQAEPLGSGTIQDFMAGMAREYGIWLIGGTLPLASPDAGKVINTTLVYNPQGEHVGRYDKIHLFGFTKGTESYNESRTIVPGSTVGTVDTPLGKVGLSVCYDLRFPELYRAMGPVSLIVVPAAFTYTTGKAHWEVLLRARAIENQCYVLAAAQGGEHANGRRTWGHSMLIDPWGEIKAVLAEGEGVVRGEIDRVFMDSVRESLPALKHRTM